MKIMARCPFCHVRVRLEEHCEGGSIPCPRCQNTFTPVREDDAPALRPTRAATGKNEAGTEETKSPQFPQQKSKKAAEEIPSVSTSALDLEENKPKLIDPASACAVVLAGLALLFASFVRLSSLTVPFAVIGLLLAIAGVLVDSRKTKVGVFGPLAGGVLCVGVLMSTFFFSPFFGIHWSRAGQAGLATHKAYWITDRPGMPAEISEREPLEGQQGAWRKGPIQVRLSRVEAKAVRIDAKKGETKSQLLIGIKVSHVGIEKSVPSQGWSQENPTLKDSQGRSFQTVAAPGAPGIRKGMDGPLTPGRFFEEMYTFEMPPAESTGWTLVVPLAPLGQKGQLTWKVPQPKLENQ